MNRSASNHVLSKLFRGTTWVMGHQLASLPVTDQHLTLRTHRELTATAQSSLRLLPALVGCLKGNKEGCLRSAHEDHSAQRCSTCAHSHGGHLRAEGGWFRVAPRTRKAASSYRGQVGRPTRGDCACLAARAPFSAVVIFLPVGSPGGAKYICAVDRVGCGVLGARLWSQGFAAAQSGEKNPTQMASSIESASRRFVHQVTAFRARATGATGGHCLFTAALPVKLVGPVKADEALGCRRSNPPPTQYNNETKVVSDFLSQLILTRGSCWLTTHARHGGSVQV